MDSQPSWFVRGQYGQAHHQQPSPRKTQPPIQSRPHPPPSQYLITSNTEMNTLTAASASGNSTRHYPNAHPIHTERSTDPSAELYSAPTAGSYTPFPPRHQLSNPNDNTQQQYRPFAVSMRDKMGNDCSVDTAKYSHFYSDEPTNILHTQPPVLRREATSFSYSPLRPPMKANVPSQAYLQVPLKQLRAEYGFDGNLNETKASRKPVRSSDISDKSLAPLRGLPDLHAVAHTLIFLPMEEVTNITRNLLENHELLHKFNALLAEISKFRNRKINLDEIMLSLQRELGPVCFEELCSIMSTEEAAKHAAFKLEERALTYKPIHPETPVHGAKLAVEYATETGNVRPSTKGDLRDETYGDLLDEADATETSGKSATTPTPRQFQESLQKTKSFAASIPCRTKKIKTDDGKSSPSNSDAPSYQSSPRDMANFMYGFVSKAVESMHPYKYSTPDDTTDTREQREGMSIHWCLPDEERPNFVYAACPEVRELVAKKKLTREYLRVDALIDRADYLASLRLQANKRNVLNFVALDKQNFQQDILATFIPNIENTPVNAFEKEDLQSMKPEFILKHVLNLSPPLFWRDSLGKRPAGAVLVGDAVLEHLAVIASERTKRILKCLLKASKSRRVQSSQKSEATTKGQITDGNRPSKKGGSGKSVPLRFTRQQSLQMFLPSEPAAFSVAEETPFSLMPPPSETLKQFYLTVEDLRWSMHKRAFPFSPRYYQDFIESLLARY